MSIQGLLTVKPENTPIVGTVKTFTVEQRIAASGKAWNKVKSAAPDQGGQLYRIMSAIPTGRTDPHGNISFNVELDADPTAQPTPSPARQVARGDAHTSGSRPPQGTNHWDERSGRIERQHSQEMALRYCELNGITIGEKRSETIATKEDFVALISWFQRDIGRPPLADQAKEMFNATEPEPDEIDIPYGDQE